MNPSRRDAGAEGGAHIAGAYDGDLHFSPLSQLNSVSGGASQRVCWAWVEL